MLQAPLTVSIIPVMHSIRCKDAAWFDVDGSELDDSDWFNPSVRTIGMYVDGRGLRHRDERNEALVDDSYLLVLHAGDAEVDFVLPGPPWADSYETVVDTTQPGGEPGPSRSLAAKKPLHLIARSAYLLRVVRR